MQSQQNRQDAEVQVEVVRAAAALERERAARLREDAADARWFARRLAEMFRADRERLRSAAGRLRLAGRPLGPGDPTGPSSGPGPAAVPRSVLRDRGRPRAAGMVTGV